MIRPEDLVVLPHSVDLTQAGIAYACRSLPHTYDRMGGSPFDRLRRIVAGVGVELAFRRHLTAENVPFDVLGATPFTEPDRYDVALGGRRVDVKSYLVLNKTRIQEIRTKPEMLLEAPALVPSDQLASDRLRNEDLYLFAFLTALVTKRREELEQALAAEQPAFIMAPMPEHWARPVRWASLSPLALKSDAANPVRLALGGQNLQREFQMAEVLLEPGKRVQLRQNFYALTYLAASAEPDGRVGVHSPGLDETYIIPTDGWGNIWVYGLEVYLAGYITRGEFRRRSRRLPPGTPVLQYARTRTENMALPMRELHPISDLMTRARNWAQGGGGR